MDDLLKLCRENRFCKKILLVSSFPEGRNRIKTLTEKTGVLNLKIETVHSLASEIAQIYLRKNRLTPINDNLSRQILFNVIYKTQKNSGFEYFTGIEITPSVTGSVWNAVMELKYAQIQSFDIKEDQFVCFAKGRDMKRIMTEYASVLRDNAYVDSPDIVKIAAEIEGNQEGLLLVQDNLKLSSLEKMFIKDKFSHVRVICGPPVKGLDVPSYHYEVICPETDSHSLFSYLYAPEEREGSFSYSHIKLLRAWGENNEIRAILRDLRDKNVPFDHGCIYVTTKEPYTQLLYQQTGQLEIPVTFGCGINIGNTGPGKAFLNIVKWVKGNYQVLDLYQLLYEGMLIIPDGFFEDGNTDINLFHIAKLLRSSGIGWGRDRYIKKLEEQITSARQSEQHDSGIKLKTARAAKKFIAGLLEKIPAGKDPTLHQLAGGIFALLREYAGVKNETDAEAKEAILEVLQDITDCPDLGMETDEALLNMENRINSIRVGSSETKPGCLHLCDYRSGEFLSRRHNYILGLNADRFPGKAAEDPILLDMEKERLSCNLLPNKTALKENLYAMVRLLSGLEGNITLAYSSYDPVENREQSPSPLLLQVYRMITGDPSGDYSELKKYLHHAEGYIPERGLDENEFWLNKCYGSMDLSGIKELVFQCRPHLRQGRKAWEQQNSGRFTRYDGYIGKIGENKDVRVFSASMFELLAKCSYQYYLRHVLHVTPPGDVLYDPEIWLDPLTKGMLYHSIFEQFYKALSQKGEKPNREKHSRLICHLADKLIYNLKEHIPPPGEVVFDLERRDILESCLIFLAGEEEHADEGTPEFFELGFGLKNEEASCPSVEITLPSGKKFLLSGKIDRIDRLGESIYRIVDYKSGGNYGYKDREFFKGGRQIQHALYAHACEVLMKNNILKAEAKVVEGVYLFPTQKGEGRRYVRLQKEKQILMELLEDLLSIIDEGAFVATGDPADCRWCEYQVVCRIERMHAFIRDKRNDMEAEGLSGVRRLGSYE